MFTLYYKPTCPYCQYVLGEAEALGVQFTLKDISSDSNLVKELIERGGKKQVPYLVDEANGVEMYESEDIVSYLKEHHAESGSERTFGGLRVYQSNDVCESCQ